MNENLLQFLNSRKIEQTTIDRLIEENIDENVLALMSIEELKKLFSKYGDCIAILDFCKKGQINKKKNSLLEKLREKIKRKNKSTVVCEEEDEKIEPLKKKNALKETRQVVIGWFCSLNGGVFKQVRIKNGGGTRKVHLPKASKKEEIINRALELFFPNGVSSKGKVEHFTFDLLDYQHLTFDNELTIEEIFKATGLPILRFYLSSTQIESVMKPMSEEQRLENSENVYERINSSTLPTITLTDFYETVSSNVEAFPLDVLSVNTSYNNFGMNLETSDEAVFENCRIECPNASDEIVELFIRRSNLVDDVLSFYESQDTSILEKKLQVTFLSEMGQDQGGLTKEMFHSFFEIAQDRFFIGEEALVPYMPLHQLRKEKYLYSTLGIILTHMAILTKTVPVKLSITVFAILSDRQLCNRDILSEFLLYLTPTERKFINLGMASFSLLNTEETSYIQSFFIANGMYDLPKEKDFQNQLVALAEDILVTKPNSLIMAMRDKIPLHHLMTVWRPLTKEKLEAIRHSQKPSPEKVVKILKLEKDYLQNSEEKTLYYLKTFIRSTENDSELLHKFLIFCTASSNMPKFITVSFSNLNGLARRPVAHTCSNTIEIPSTYSSLQEFQKEMKAFLNNELSFEYSLA